MSEQETLKGDTIGRVWAFTVDDGTGTETLTDPDTITIKIYDPAGALIATLSKADLIKLETGKWKMTWNVPSNGAVGMWKMFVTGVVATKSNTERFTFNVIE